LAGGLAHEDGASFYVSTIAHRLHDDRFRFYFRRLGIPERHQAWNIKASMPALRL
jgi:hypothetical protein